MPFSGYVVADVVSDAGALLAIVAERHVLGLSGVAPSEHNPNAISGAAPVVAIFGMSPHRASLRAEGTVATICSPRAKSPSGHGRPVGRRLVGAAGQYAACADSASTNSTKKGRYDVEHAVTFLR